MVTAKERLEEIGRKHPIEKSINEHHKGVILSVIHNYMRVLSKNITEIKSDYRKIRLYEETLKS